MAKKYIFVRMPEDTYKLYKNIKFNMQNDLKRITGRETKLTMPKVFRAIASPEFNENFIQIDLKKLVYLARSKQK